MLKNIAIAAILAIVCDIFFLNWLLNDDATKPFYSQAILDKGYVSAGITHINIEYKDDMVLLNVTLSKPLRCDEIFEIMDIGDLPLRGKLYTPTCTSLELSSAVITYVEKNE